MFVVESTFSEATTLKLKSKKFFGNLGINKINGNKVLTKQIKTSNNITLKAASTTKLFFP